MDLGIKNKIALVTGGASGIGKAIAADLALEGATVIITSRSDKKLKDALTELKKINWKFYHYILNALLMHCNTFGLLSDHP